MDVLKCRDTEQNPIFKIGDAYIKQLSGIVNRSASNFVELTDWQMGKVRIVLGSRSEQKNNRLILKSLRAGDNIRAFPVQRECESHVWLETVIQRM